MPIATRDARLLRALFDVSFTEFVTPKMIKLLYVLSLAAIGLWALVLVVAALTQSLIVGLGYLLAAILLFLVGAILVRVWLEIIAVVFRIAANTAEIAEYGAEIAVNTGRPAAQQNPGRIAGASQRTHETTDRSSTDANRRSVDPMHQKAKSNHEEDS